MGNLVEEARYVANDLEASDTLQGYRGARTIRALATDYDTKVIDCDTWHDRFKEAHNARNELVVAVNELTGGLAGTLEALAGCMDCKQRNPAISYCHGCLVSIAKAAEALQQ